MDLRELYLKADGIASNFVENMPEDTDLEADSILPGWSIRTLLNHLISENLWTPDIVEGKTIEEVGDKYDGDVSGDDPKKAWRDSSLKAKEAVQNLKDTEQEVHLSYADVPVSEYLSQRITDLVIHGWDLAKSTNQDDTLPTDLLQYIWDRDSNREAEIRATGIFGDHVDVPEDADLQTKVLALLGRKKD